MKADTESKKKKGSNFFHYLCTWSTENQLIKKTTTLRFESGNNI